MNYCLIIGAVVATLVSGILYGRLSQRWGPSESAVETAFRVSAFPEEFGDWKMTKSDKLSEKVVDMLQCTGYFNRYYINQRTGNIVGVALLLGPHGQIAVHTPEICYSSRQFKLTHKRRPLTFPEHAHSSFWQVTFESTDVDKSLLRVYYGWTVDGNWAAAANPRFGYAGQPYLFKIQLATNLPLESDPEYQDAGQRFLNDFIPAFRRHVIQSN